jgi:transcriptional repressor NrdR
MRFTTFESAELAPPTVIKNDGSRQAFDEVRLRKGFKRALEKRPVETEKVNDAIERIRRRMIKSGDREVASNDIGTWVMDELRNLDDVGYIRFASVYRRFQDVNAFREMVEKLEKETMLGNDMQMQLLTGDDQDPLRKEYKKSLAKNSSDES